VRAAAVLLLLALAPAAAALGADAPRVAASAARTEVGVGESFTVEVTANGPAGTEWTFPAETGNESVELRTPPLPPGAGPEAAPPAVHRYQATAFALSDVAVPAITVKYRLPDGTAGEASTAPIPLRIVSVLPKDPAQQQLADIRGPLALRIGLAFWAALAAVVLLLAGLALWLVRRRRPVAAPAVAAPEETPEAQAQRALDALAASDLLARGELRAYYIALTEIAKRYLERRLDAPVLEMTSSETVGFLRAHPALHDVAFAVRDLTNAADRVKFARGLAAAEEGQRHLGMVRQLVETVEQRLRPAPAEAVA